MDYSFYPLEQHSDYGYGAHADSFAQGAEILHEQVNRLAQGHAVLNYLYRHATELYLKSMIVVLHKYLQLPYPGKWPEPSILENGEPRLLSRTHSLRVLLDYFVEVATNHRSAFQKPKMTDWSDVPVEYRARIYELDLKDAASTYFRYPTIKNPSCDNSKSVVQRRTIPEILDKSENGPVKLFFTVDEDDNVVDSFSFEPGIDEATTRNLAQSCQDFSSAHLGMRAELMGGM